MRWAVRAAEPWGRLRRHRLQPLSGGAERQLEVQWDDLRLRLRDRLHQERLILHSAKWYWRGAWNGWRHGHRRRRRRLRTAVRLDGSIQPIRMHGGLLAERQELRPLHALQLLYLHLSAGLRRMPPSVVYDARYLRRSMAKHGLKLAVSAGLSVALAAPGALAQGDEKKPMDDDDVVFDNTKPKKKDEPDVVFDNTAPPPEEPEKLDNASTFATTNPDAPDERRRRFRPGWAAGFRLGWGIPGGDFEKSQAGTSGLSESITGVLGIGIDAGYRINENLYVLLNLGGGYVFPKNCSGGASCSGWQFRAGPMGMWRFLPFQNISPWVGLGAGYEYIVQSATIGGSEVNSAYHGFQFVEVSGGAHFRTSRTYAGPFVSFALGQYGSMSRSGNVAGKEIDESGSVEDPATHQWITLGLHAVLD